MRSPTAALVALVALAACVGGATAQTGQGRPNEEVMDLAYTKLRRMELLAGVEEMFDHSWTGYMKNAFPSDELKPLTCSQSDLFGGYTLTVIDTLDTLILFNKLDEFQSAVKWLERNMDFEKDRMVSVFESNIRALGGLLSAHLIALRLLSPEVYHGSLLHLADGLATRMLPAFDTPTGIPYNEINLVRGVDAAKGHTTCPAASGTLMLEFGLLGALTNKCAYVEVAYRAAVSTWGFRTPYNLMGTILDIHSGKWLLQFADIGASHDSFFEYLIKSYVLFNDDMWLKIWHPAFHAAQVRLMHSTGVYIKADARTGSPAEYQVNSLQAFWPGLLVMMGEIETAIISFRTFECAFDRYYLMPESFDVQPSQLRGRGYPLRPEMIESAWYLHQATGDPHYLRFGERIMQRINATARTKCGFAAVVDVATRGLENKMDSYFLAETLKYLHLLLDPEGSPLMQLNAFDHVLNTEAHPIPVHADIADKYHACLDPKLASRGGGGTGGLGGRSGKTKIPPNDGRTTFPLASHFKYTHKLPAFFDGPTQFERYDAKKYDPHRVSRHAQRKQCAPLPHYMRIAHLIKHDGRCLPEDYGGAAATVGQPRESRGRRSARSRGDGAGGGVGADATVTLKFDVRGTAARGVDPEDADADTTVPNAYAMTLTLPKDSNVKHQAYAGYVLLPGLTTGMLGAAESLAITLTTPDRTRMRAEAAARHRQLAGGGGRRLVTEGAVLAGEVASLAIGETDTALRQHVRFATGDARQGFRDFTATAGLDTHRVVHADIALLSERPVQLLVRDPCDPNESPTKSQLIPGAIVILVRAHAKTCSVAEKLAYIKAAGGVAVVFLGFRPELGEVLQGGGPALPVLWVSYADGVPLMQEYAAAPRSMVGSVLLLRNAAAGLNTELYVIDRSADTTTDVDDHLAPVHLSPPARLRCALTVVSQLAQRYASQTARRITPLASPTQSRTPGFDPLAAAEAACRNAYAELPSVVAQVRDAMLQLFTHFSETHRPTFETRIASIARTTLCIAAGRRALQAGELGALADLTERLDAGGVDPAPSARGGGASTAVPDARVDEGMARKGDEPLADASWPRAADITDSNLWKRGHWEYTMRHEAQAGCFFEATETPPDICREAPVHEFIGSRALFGVDVGYGPSEASAARVDRAPIATAREVDAANAMACHDFTSEAHREAIGGRVLVAERGVCTFHQKAAVAEAAGAVGLMVISNSEDAPETMSDYPGDKEIRIPLAMLSRADGVVLDALMARGAGAAASTPPPQLEVSVEECSPRHGTVDLRHSEVLAADTPLGLVIWSTRHRTAPPPLLHASSLDAALQQSQHLARRQRILHDTPAPHMAPDVPAGAPHDDVHGRHGQATMQGAYGSDMVLPRESASVVVTTRRPVPRKRTLPTAAHFVHEYKRAIVSSWESALDALMWVSEHNAPAAIGVTARLYHQPIGKGCGVLKWYYIEPTAQVEKFFEAMDDEQMVIEQLDGYYSRELVDLNADYDIAGDSYSWVDLTTWRSCAHAQRFIARFEDNGLAPGVLRTHVDAPDALEHHWHGSTMPQYPIVEECTSTTACGAAGTEP